MSHIYAYDSNINEIKSTLDNLDLSSNDKYSIENFFIHNIEIENSYKLSKDTPRFSIFNYNLVNEFRKDNILEVNCTVVSHIYTYNRAKTLSFISLIRRKNTEFENETDV